MKRIVFLLGAATMVTIITACTTAVQPEPQFKLCDVRSLQPSGIGAYWIYETTVQPEGRVTIDSMIVSDTSVIGSSTLFTIQCFIDGALANTFNSSIYGSPSPYLWEQIPGMFNDLRSPAPKDDLKIQGPILYCGSSLSPSSFSVQLDSMDAVDSLGNKIRVGVQYHIVSDGSLTSGTMSELSISMPSPTIPTSSPIRRVNIATNDTVMIQQPYYVTFTNGRRYYTASTQLQRTYAWGVGMLLETITQEIGEPSTTGTRSRSSTRRLLRYGHVK